MEEMLQIGIVVLTVAILVFVLAENILKRRRVRVLNNNQMNYAASSRTSADTTSCQFHLPVIEEAIQKNPEDAFLSLSVLAKSGSRFESYDLFQAISAAGLKFGEMNIFHYHDAKTMKTLFSLASATKPGDFNLDRMGEFSCHGLTLFMDLNSVADPKRSFQLMLETAEYLTDDLDGELHAAPRKPWNENFSEQYQQKIARYQKS